MTAFALLPLGFAASYLLRQQDWQALFVAGFPQANETTDDVYSAGYSEVTEASVS